METNNIFKINVKNNYYFTREYNTVNNSTHLAFTEAYTGRHIEVFNIDSIETYQEPTILYMKNGHSRKLPLSRLVMHINRHYNTDQNVIVNNPMPNKTQLLEILETLNKIGQVNNFKCKLLERETY